MEEHGSTSSIVGRTDVRRIISGRVCELMISLGESSIIIGRVARKHTRSMQKITIKPMEMINRRMDAIDVLLKRMNYVIKSICRYIYIALSQ